MAFPQNNKHYDGGCRAARDPDDAIPTNGRGRRQMRVKLDLGRKALSHHQPPRGCRRDSSARTECRPAELPGYWSCAANCLLLRQKLALCAGCRRWRGGGKSSRDPRVVLGEMVGRPYAPGGRAPATCRSRIPVTCRATCRFRQACHVGRHSLCPCTGGEVDE